MLVQSNIVQNQPANTVEAAEEFWSDHQLDVIATKSLCEFLVRTADVGTMKVQETPVAVPNRDEEFPAHFPNRLYIAPSPAIINSCKHHQCVFSLVEAVVG